MHGSRPPVVPGEPHMTMPTNLRRGASAIALGLALSVFVPGAALAQDAGTAPVDEASAEDAIVATGIPGAVNNPVQAQQTNTSTVEDMSDASTGKPPHPSPPDHPTPPA